MVRIEDGNVVEVGLPQSGYLKDGKSVSGYNLLPEDILKDEGWLPLLDIHTEEQTFIRYDIQENQVLTVYE